MKDFGAGGCGERGLVEGISGGADEESLGKGEAQVSGEGMVSDRWENGGSGGREDVG